MNSENTYFSNFGKYAYIALSKKPRVMVMLLGVLSSVFYSLFSYEFDGNQVYSYGFGFVGLVLGTYFLAYQKVVNGNRAFSKLTPIIFAVLGFGFSCLIHLRYESPYLVSKLKYYEIFVPIAVGCFVYIFWVAFFSIKRLKLLWSSLAISFLPIFIYALTFPYKTNGQSSLEVLLEPTVLVVNYCAAIIFVFCTISLFSKDYLKNIILHAFILGIVITIIINISLAFAYLQGVSESERAGMVGVLSFSLLVLIANIFNLKNVLKKPSFKKGQPKRRISVTFEWIFLLPALVINYSIYLAILALVPYFGVSRKLSSFDEMHKETPLDKANLRRASCLSIGAFFTYLVFFMVHETTENTLLWWCLEWLIGSIVVSFTLSECLYEDPI